MASTGIDRRDRRSRGTSAEKRRMASMLLAIKSSGYLVSTLSVVLLAAVSWKSASEEPLLMACLIAGTATSVAGMFLRWLSYEIQERRKAKGQE
jgi:hypothetical protein